MPGAGLCVTSNNSTSKNHAIPVKPSVKFDAKLHKAHTNVAGTKVLRPDKLRSIISLSKITIGSEVITYLAKKSKVTKKSRMRDGQNVKRVR